MIKGQTKQEKKENTVEVLISGRKIESKLSDGISHKLGILSGRLRGLDNEKDIVESIKND